MSTWEPDWGEVGNTLWDHLDRYMEWGEALEAAQSVITEYRRQQAAAGRVEVRQEDVLFAVWMLAKDELVSDEHSGAAIDRLLAAAKEQP
jgi:hypothetical protein